MTLEKGYLFIRSDENYDIDNAYYLGITNNLYEQNKALNIINENNKGKFKLVLEVLINRMERIESLLKVYFYNYNVNSDCGSNFYKKEILDKIEPYLDSINEYYLKLSDEKIKLLI